MPSYQFPNSGFPNQIFVAPTVTPNREDIRVHVSQNSISVPVTLTAAGIVPSVVMVENIPVMNLSWESDENLMMRVNEGLVQYEV
jgi:hypothetical protein